MVANVSLLIRCAVLKECDFIARSQLHSINLAV